MKIVIAPDSFKESMSGKVACDAIERGLKKVLKDVEFIKVPMADGGEGTTESLVDATGGKIYYTEVTNPLGEKIQGKLGVLGDKETAILEMASASGLELISKEKRDPMVTTTFGTGELIKKALDLNVKTILIGIGGSATNDGGAGMIQALGGKLLDKNNNEIGFGGGELSKLERIDLAQLDERLKEVKIIVACDVDNPLTGERGAAYIFARQKGATDETVKILDDNLKHFADVIRRDLKIDVENIEGAGAAGGLGAGLMAFLSAELKRGIDIVIEYSKLEEKLEGASFVITGEGSIDGQTHFGKTPYGVAKTAKKYGIPVIALAGNVSEDIDILYDYGFDAIFSILSGVQTLETALKNGEKNLERVSENIGRLILTFKNKNL